MKGLCWVLLICILPMRTLGQQTSPAAQQKQDHTIAPYAREAVEFLKAEQVLWGFPGGRFSGAEIATRFTLLKLLGRSLYRVHILSLPEMNQRKSANTALLAAFDTPRSSAIVDGILKDIDNNHWQIEGQNAIDAGLISAFPDVYFRGKGALTRAQLASVVTNCLVRLRQEPVLDLKRADFKDIEGSEWYFGATLAAAGCGMMEGYADGTFRPHQTVTRNELGVVFARLVKLMKSNG